MLLSGLTVSCKDEDDDKDGHIPEEIAQDPFEKESEAGDALYRLVCQLSVGDSLPDNWKTATFEPKLGQVLDPSKPFVRTISVNDAAGAVTQYNSLTGKNLPATTMSDTYTVDGVGTLTFTMGGSGTIATIDFDVKQMPKLQQLRMVDPGSMGENGSFSGEPYYRFGDVVKDKDGFCWICVRPAYSPDSKEDTHWMSFQVGSKNVKEYTKSKCKKQNYPVDLGVQKEKMQYLAQLMAILVNPEGYKQEAASTAGYYFGTNDHKTGLGGLQEEAMRVEDLVTLSMMWKKNEIWEEVLPVGFDNDDVDEFQARFKNDVTFIYEKGSTSGTKLNIPIVTYSGAGKFYKNEPTYATVTVNMQDVAFDVTNSYTNLGERGDDNYPVPDAFVVRYKTGFQLSSNWFFNPKATEAIEGVTEVFRFNAHKNEFPKYEERGYYDVGDVVKDNEGNRWFCIQNSAYGNDMYSSIKPFAYFISLDEGAVGENLENITSNKDLAAQMLFNMEVIYHNLQVSRGVNNPGSSTSKQLKHLQDNTGIEMTDLFGVRDTLHKFRSDKEANVLQNNFISTFYRDKNNQLCVLRLIGDYTAEQPGGGRDWSWQFWDRYSQGKSRTMTLNDLADQDIVNTYNKDTWVNLVWNDWVNNKKISTNIGPRTQVEKISPLSRFIYQKGRTAPAGTVPANMYREPIIPFAVKRVFDEGRSSKTFDDGTAFTHVSLLQTALEDFDVDEEPTFTPATLGAYLTYAGKLMTLNLEPYYFKMDNKP